MLPLTSFGLVSAPWSQAQVPWSRSLLSHATWVIRLPSVFRNSRCFPPTAFTSRFRSPLPGLRHCFRSQVPVSSGRVLRFARHPCLVTAESEPPGFKPRPLVFFTSARAAPVSVLAIFRSFHCFPSFAFDLTVPNPFPGIRHCFRSLCAGVVRPRAVVCTPPLSRSGPSQSPLVISPGPSASLLSAADFPRERLSHPVNRLSPYGSQDPRGPCDASRPASPAACSGLHATPVDVAQQSCLTPIRRSGSRTYSSVLR